MRAEIVSVGTELLLGDIVDTNAQYLSKELALLGVSIYRKTTVGDNEDRLREALVRALEECELIITTGGLGPTPDDITKEVSAKVLGKDLLLHEPSYRRIESYFKNSNRAMENGNGKQAMFPENSIILENRHGTAPGCIILGPEGRYIVNLPGPPREMVPMFEDKVKPFLLQFMESTILSRTLRCVGLGEWDMATRVHDFIEESVNPTVAPYAKEGEAILRITAKATNREEALALIAPMETAIRERIGDFIYGVDEDTLENVLGALLVSKGIKVAVAESITGGMIADHLLSYEGGMSQVFEEGFITYSNESKMKYLGVKKETLMQYGAVSEEVCREMAEGLLVQTGAQVGIVTTGIAGPTGGTEKKPVGLVYTGINIAGEITIFEDRFMGGRDRIRMRTTITALDRLRRKVQAL